MTGFFSSPPALVWPDQFDARLWPPCEEPVDSEEASGTAQTQVQDRIIDLPQQQQTAQVVCLIGNVSSEAEPVPLVPAPCLFFQRILPVNLCVSTAWLIFLQ